MVSILIPVYNEFVSSLVESLLCQLYDLNVPGEILLYDDFSLDVYKQENRKLADLDPCIRYQELPANSGRSAIRNLLFKDAHYDFCIVLDCDSELRDAHFIQRYLDFANHPVIYGGRTYHSQPPKDKTKTLRWKYGVEREQIDFRKRAKQPYRFFLTNNFALRKEVFLKVQFDLRVNGYGHEDTLFSRDLERNRIPVLHIDNPVNHIGLESSQVFLEKSVTALKNLLMLHKAQRIQSDSVALLNAYKTIERLGLLNIWLRIGNAFLPKWEKNLNATNPQLIAFDLYRLYWLCKLASKSL